MNASTARDGTVSDDARHRTWTYGNCVMQREAESSTVATHKAESADHRVRPRVLQQHFGHSGAMPAASTGEIQQPDACTRRPQHWGRGSGRLDRCTNAEKVP